MFLMGLNIIEILVFSEFKLGFNAFPIKILMSFYWDCIESLEQEEEN